MRKVIGIGFCLVMLWQAEPSAAQSSETCVNQRRTLGALGVEVRDDLKFWQYGAAMEKLDDIDAENLGCEDQKLLRQLRTELLEARVHDAFERIIGSEDTAASLEDGASHAASGSAKYARQRQAFRDDYLHLRTKTVDDPNENGICAILFDVLPNGSTQNPEVICNHRDLKEPALSAVRGFALPMRARSGQRVRANNRSIMIRLTSD